MTKHPIDIIKSGDYNKVPMIIGYCSNEGLYSLLKPALAVKPYKFDHLIPQQMTSPEDGDLRGELCEKISNFYLNPKYIDNIYLVSIP